MLARVTGARPTACESSLEVKQEGMRRTKRDVEMVPVRVDAPEPIIGYGTAPQVTVTVMVSVPSFPDASRTVSVTT